MTSLLKKGLESSSSPSWIPHFELLKCISYYLKPVSVEVIVVEKLICVQKDA